MFMQTLFLIAFSLSISTLVACKPEAAMLSAPDAANAAEYQTLLKKLSAELDLSAHVEQTAALSIEDYFRFFSTRSTQFQPNSDLLAGWHATYSTVGDLIAKSGSNSGVPTASEYIRAKKLLKASLDQLKDPSAEASEVETDHASLGLMAKLTVLLAHRSEVRDLGLVTINPEVEVRGFYPDEPPSTVSSTESKSKPTATEDSHMGSTGNRDSRTINPNTKSAMQQAEDTYLVRKGEIDAEDLQLELTDEAAYYWLKKGALKMLTR